jgi:riboflavin biosynthesis pyrimidine reductase
MQLLIDRGHVATPPQEISPDQEGAAHLARIYAPDPGRVTVRAMMNTTIDGAVTGADGTSGPLRNPDDSFLFSVLRALTDVVLVGAGTVRVEDYRRPLGHPDLLTPSRRPAGGTRPALAILSRTGDLPPVEAHQPTLVLTPRSERQAAIVRTGLPPQQVLSVEDPAGAIAALTDRGYRAIQAEGGPSTLASLASADLLDELCFSIRHRTVAGPSPRVMSGPQHETAWQVETMLLGRDATLTRYRRR